MKQTLPGLTLDLIFLDADKTVWAIKKRHHFDPDEIDAQIQVAIAENERYRERAKTWNAQAHASYRSSGGKGWFGRTPDDPAWIDPYHDERNRKEREYYSQAHVVEMMGGEKPFRLVYADDRQYTGPFETLEQAMDWYRKSGR